MLEIPKDCCREVNRIFQQQLSQTEAILPLQ